MYKWQNALMRKVFAASHVRTGQRCRNKKSFSSATATATAPLAPESTTGFSKKVKMYGLMSSPLILFTIISVTTLNSKDFKDFVESYFPSYIAFVRTYYGYPEEDIALDRRRKQDLLIQAAPVNFRVYLDDGDVMHVNNVDGLKNYDEFQAHLIDLCGGRSIVDIVAEDSIEPIKEVQETHIDSSSDNIHGMEERSSNSVNLHYHSCFVRFDSNDCIVDYSNVRTVPFFNRWLNGFRDYRKIQNKFSLAVIRSYIPKTMASSSTVSTASISAQGRTTVSKSEALSRISQLEVELKYWESERIIGYKSIDDITSNITRIKNEIVMLRRKYINTFYFF